MAYDFQAAINAARAVVEKSQNNDSGNKNYRYPLVYPQAGSTIVIRPLFNPASGQILRLVNRHEKVACYRTYGVECPICKVMQQVKDLTGQDPFGRVKSSKSRGLAFAQYISSTVQISKGENKGFLQPGEIVLFMFPWSVYQQINETIQAVSQTPTGMDQAFCHAASGLYIQVSVTSDFKYTTTTVPYLSFPTQMTDDDFHKMLDGMESLYEQVLPSTINEEVDKQVKEYENQIYKQYIEPRVPTVGVPQGTAPQNFSQIPQPQVNPGAVNQQFTGYQPPMGPGVGQQALGYYADFSRISQSTGGYVQPTASTVATTPTASTTVAQAFPSCMGQHQAGSPKCIVCPDEMLCLEKSAK